MKKKNANMLGTLIGLVMLSPTMIFVIIGSICMFFGFKEYFGIKEKSQMYLETVGYFENAKYSSSGDDGPTYNLEYRYTVNGKDYFVETDYSTNMIPQKGTPKTILYDSDFPEEAIIKNGGSYEILIFIGAMFVLFPLCMISTMSGLIPPQFSMGTLFFIAGIGMYYMMTMEASSRNLVVAFREVGLLMLFPFIFSAVGLGIACTGIKEIIVEKKEIKKYNEKVKIEIKSEENEKLDDDPINMK